MAAVGAMVSASSDLFRRMCRHHRRWPRRATVLASSRRCPWSSKSLRRRRRTGCRPARRETSGRPRARASKAASATAASSDSSIRVSVGVDQLINLVGELVITQAMLLQTATQMQENVPERLVNGLAQLERNTRDLQESVMSIRMMPISFVFSRFPRVVRDLSGKLGKQVELKTTGETTELDKSLIERIADPLTH